MTILNVNNDDLLQADHGAGGPAAGGQAQDAQAHHRQAEGQARDCVQGLS